MMNQFYQLSPAGLTAGVKRLGKAAFALALSAFMTLSVYAQTINVSGKVTDNKGEGIPSVTVQVKGTTKATQTDIDGNYQLNAVPSNATLVYSFVGMTTQEVAVSGRSNVSIVLLDDAKALEEVVVVGYGTQKRKEISGTVSSVDSKEFNAGLVANPLQAVQGKVAGLVISQQGGDPTATPTVRLRGTGSLSANSSPLYVVDGVYVENINNISPQDIESIDVLRDASSAAIYGSRAANGVIMVTTKRGKEGRTSLDYTGYVGTQSPSRLPDFLSASEYRDALKKLNVQFQDNGADTDWTGAMLRDNAYAMNHDLAFSGGTKAFSYRASLGFLQNQGVIRNSDRNRLSARLNANQKALNDKLDIQYNLSFIQNNDAFVDYSAFSVASNMQPTDPVFNADGTYFERTGDFSKFNPVSLLDNQSNNRRRNEYLGALRLTYNLLENLSFTVRGTLDGRLDNTDYFANRTPRNLAVFKGLASRGSHDRINQMYNMYVNYDLNVGTAAKLGLLAGHEYQSLTNSGFTASNRNFITDDLGANNLGGGIGNSIGDGVNGAVSSYKANERLASFFGRAQFSMANKYFATATLRRDGSSKFGANNKWGTFPSFSVGWTLSEESFLKGNATLNNLKFRANWGQTGQSNDIAPYNTLSLLGPGERFYSAGNWLPAYVPLQNPNPDLKWEVNESYGAGIDFGLWKSRLTGSLDYYVRNTRDLLYNVPSPPTWTDQAGTTFFPRVSTILANVGSMQNTGIELMLDGQIIDSKKLSWRMIFAGGPQTNKVVSLAAGPFSAGDRLLIGTGLGDFIRGTSNVQFSIIRPGYAVGEFWGAKVTEVDENGQFVVEDINGDGKQDPIGDDRTFIGSPQPRFVAALTNQFNFGNFNLQFLLNGRFGNKIFNANRMLLGRQTRLTSSAENALREAATTNVKDDRTGSYDYYVEPGDFVRLDNFRLGYNIPVKDKLLRNANVYVSGNNLFVLTKYTGIDPEINLNGLTPGIDTRSFFFPTRGFQVGVNLSF